jgi:hypothetical protein
MRDRRLIDTVALVRTIKFGKYTATLSMARPRPGATISMTAEWHPDVPQDLSPGEQAEYQRQLVAATRSLMEQAYLEAKQAGLSFDPGEGGEPEVHLLG